MSIQPPLPSPIVQMGHVEKVVETAHSHPEVQQHVSQEIARKNLQDQRSQVEKGQGAEKTGESKVNKDGKGGSTPHQQPKKDRKPLPESPEPSEPANPLAGNIINVKI
jgi:hypothetical protein